MKNDDFNIWRDLFGYHDMDFDGDVDIVDVDLADEIYDNVNNALNRKSSYDFDDCDGDDFDGFDDFDF